MEAISHGGYLNVTFELGWREVECVGKGRDVTVGVQHNFLMAHPRQPLFELRPIQFS